MGDALSRADASPHFWLLLSAIPVEDVGGEAEVARVVVDVIVAAEREQVADPVNDLRVVQQSI